MKMKHSSLAYAPMFFGALFSINVLAETTRMIDLGEKMNSQLQAFRQRSNYMEELHSTRNESKTALEALKETKKGSMDYLVARKKFFAAETKTLGQEAQVMKEMTVLNQNLLDTMYEYIDELSRQKMTGDVKNLNEMPREVYNNTVRTQRGAGNLIKLFEGLGYGMKNHSFNQLVQVHNGISRRYMRSSQSGGLNTVEGFEDLAEWLDVQGTLINVVYQDLQTQYDDLVISGIEGDAWAIRKQLLEGLSDGFGMNPVASIGERYNRMDAVREMDMESQNYGTAEEKTEVTPVWHELQLR